MNNIKQALESAIEVIHKNTHLRDKEATEAKLKQLNTKG